MFGNQIYHNSITDWKIGSIILFLNANFSDRAANPELNTVETKSNVKDTHLNKEKFFRDQKIMVQES